MNTGYLWKQIALLLNQILVITYLVYEYLYGRELTAPDLFPIILISILIADTIYISCINLKGSRMLSNFSFLLVLVVWYFLYTLDSQGIFLILLSLTGAVLLYAAPHFILSFFFQNSAYQFQRPADYLLRASCLLTFLMKFVNDRWFALLLLLQLVLSTAVCVFLFIVNRRRIFFVIKSEWKNFFISAFIVITIFVCYILCFGKQPEYVGSLGAYLILFLPLSSIHRIAFKNKKDTANTFLPGGKQIKLLLICLMGFFAAVAVLLRFTPSEVFIILHYGLFFILLYFILLYYSIRKKQLRNSVDFSAVGESPYVYTIAQIQREENLKMDFSNYLHDEILQDLLSIKNLLGKVDRPEIQDIISHTLDELNVSIREQMYEYHPVILKSLTIKENYQNLIDTVQKNYPQKNITIKFDCNDKLFLIDPYNYIVYRILRELITNSFKHSQASHINITLTQSRGRIELILWDNGIGTNGQIQYDQSAQKGLNSIREQLASLSGSMLIEPVNPSGLRLTIKLPMKGENSYAHFISR